VCADRAGASGSTVRKGSFFAELRFRENRFAKKKAAGKESDYALMSQVHNDFFGLKPSDYAITGKHSEAISQ